MARSGMNWVRGPRRWIPLALGLVLALSAFVIQRWSEPLSVAALVVVVVYLGDAVPAWLRGRQDTVAARAELTRRVTPTATGKSDEVLLVRNAHEDLFDRRPSRLTIPYQPRDAEEDSREVLTRRQPLLLIGPSMAGKSRLGEYLIRQHYPDRRLWMPQPKELPALLDAGTVDDAVIWLDELHEFLNVEDLRTDWVQLLTSRGGVVVATMRSNERAKFASTGRVRHPQVAALERFAPVRVVDDSPEENARLASALETPEQQSAVRQVGLGAFLGGGPVAQARLDDNRDIHPLGCALVRAAADWRRIGLSDISRAVLEDLAPHYLAEAHRHDVDETIEDGILWATERIDQLVQLLKPKGNATFTCSDYILDHLAGASNPVPTITWHTAISLKDVDQGLLFGVGMNAYEAREFDIALEAYRRIARLDNHEFAPLVFFNLGVLEEMQGNPDSARQAYQRVIDTGDSDFSPAAAINVGTIEQAQDNPTLARQTYQDAIDSGHYDHAPEAALNLGILEGEQGNPDAARAAYQLAIQSGHPGEMPKTAVNLGVLEEEQDNPDAARAAYQLAIDSGHPDQMPKAAVNLGVLEEEQDNPDTARAAYHLAIQSGHPEEMPTASFNLGGLEERQGRPLAARAAYQRAIDSGHPDQMPKAAVNLGALEVKRGKPDLAKNAFRLAIGSGHDDASFYASLNLRLLEQGRGGP